jgi:YidC/Oxa1 family membrane protein insertase
MGSDTKRLITGMVVALFLLIAYQYTLHWLYPEWKPGQPQQQAQNVTPATTQAGAATQAAGATTQPAFGGAATRASTAPAGAGGPAIAAATAPAGTWRARGADGPAAPATLGSGAKDDKQYAMAVEVLGRGAAINSVTLNSFLKTARDKNTPYTFEEPLRVDNSVRDDTRAMLTRSITVDGHTVDLSNVDWRLEGADATSARFSVDVLNGEQPVAKVVKTFTLDPRSEDGNTSQGYQVVVGHRVENLTDAPLTVRTTLNGPTVPPRELENTPDQNLIFGYWNDGEIRVVSHSIESEFTKDSAWKEFTKSDKGLPMSWAGAQSAYFNAITRPVPFGKEPRADWLFKASAELLNPHAENPHDRRVEMRLETADMTVPPKGDRRFDFEMYLGPKARKVLNTPYYSATERQYNRTLVITASSGIAALCAVCTWQWLINVLVWMLTAFHFVVRDWGLSIICLVLCVRALLHPITKKSQVHMVKMQKMGPEMEKLKKKYGDDKEMLAKAQMQFYKEQGMTPVLGCLPMFLQMPIWIALWNALQSTFELRHAPFLYGFTWIKDLSRPDYLVHFNEPVKLLFFTVSGINILPLLMGVVFYIQTKFQPKPAAMTPEQEQQQKMMTWMSTLLFPFMLYTGPSGLNLYILTSTAFGIIESKVIRKHIKEREALEAQGPTIVDAPPPPKGGRGVSKIEAEKPKGMLARLMEKAQEIQQQAEKQRKQGRPRNER